ncbi:MAG TPA: amidase [Polyangiaceae bacterium]|nr:amidase [Polyangiaceae bacterium]
MALPAGRISGAPLRALLASTRGPLTAPVAKIFRQQLGIDALLALPAAERGSLPVNPLPLQARSEHRRESLGLELPASRTWPNTSRDYQRAFQQGDLTPEALVERSIQAARRLAAQSPSVGGVMAFDESGALEAARRSAARRAAGEALPLDGVPVVIKEEVDLEGFLTALGTRFHATAAATRDATAVARLRQAGAVVIGQSPMTQYGLSPLGVNPQRQMPRNPHDPTRLAGGSSTGSGVAVATGVVPGALGLDGGGSIRVPAAFTGVFGIKPTFGRIPLTGHGLSSGTTVVHAGPIAGSSLDVALMLAAMSGPDGVDPFAEAAPATEDLLAALGRGVRGLRIGVLESEFSAASPAVASTVHDALSALRAEGAELVPVELPLAQHAAAMGFLTIGLEAYSGLLDVRREHFAELNPDVQLTFRVLGAFGSDDYLDAQRLRARLRQQAAEALRDVDVLALPTAADVAPKVTDAEMLSGFLDAAALAAACRFAFLGNLTGLPAMSVPVGAVGKLPVGLQLVGDAWDEATLLQIAAHLERLGTAHVLRPEHCVDLLT